MGLHVSSHQAPVTEGHVTNGALLLSVDSHVDPQLLVRIEGFAADVTGEGRWSACVKAVSDHVFGKGVGAAEGFTADAAVVQRLTCVAQPVALELHL